MMAAQVLVHSQLQRAIPVLNKLCLPLKSNLKIEVPICCKLSYALHEISSMLLRTSIT